MSPGSGEAPEPRPSVADRAVQAIGDIAGTLRSPHPPQGDLFEALAEEEEKVLRKYWPKGRPTGDGEPYYDELMKIRVRRRRWKARIETGGELVWLCGKLAGVIVVVGVAVNQFL